MSVPAREPVRAAGRPRRSVSDAATGSGEVLEHIQGMSAAADTTTSAVATSQAATAEVAQRAAELTTLVGNFKY